MSFAANGHPRSTQLYGFCLLLSGTVPQSFFVFRDTDICEEHKPVSDTIECACVWDTPLFKNNPMSLNMTVHPGCPPCAFSGPGIPVWEPLAVSLACLPSVPQPLPRGLCLRGSLAAALAKVLLSDPDGLLACFVCSVGLFVRGQWRRRSCSSKKGRKIWPNRSYPALENLSPSSPWLTSESFLASNFLFTMLRIVPLRVGPGTWEND